ncbi:MAG TPA: tetratricopeptide repeat protein [Candidatus Limnocylindrales bacterium]|nr:tetratricopeptide repeat protein [Candidatus Limnocylindrales bacterium]
MQTSRAFRGLDDRTLNRAIKIMVLTLVIGVPTIAVLYWMDRHVDAAPAMADRTVAAAEEAVRTKPDDLATRNHLAAAYVTADRYADGIAQFSQVLTSDSKNRPALLGRGIALITTKQYDAAAADFQAIVDGSKGGEFAATDPQLQQAYYELGVIALEQQRPADAIAPLERALKINSADADALYRYGMALIGTGDPKTGVIAIRRAVMFVPSGWCEPYAGLVTGYTALADQPGIGYANGMVAFCAGRLDEASTTLGALTQGPKKIDALLGLALVSATRGDATAATGLYQQVLAEEPSNASALIGLGQLGGSNAHASQPAASPAGSN